MLVLDDDPGTADIVRQLGEVELVVAKDTWTALAHATERRFDLVLCTRTFDERPVDALSAMLISTRGELSGRIVVLGRDLGGPEPSSQSGRAMPVLTRPLTSDILRRLLARVSK